MAQGLKSLTESIYAKFGRVGSHHHAPVTYVVLAIWVSFTYAAWDFAQRAARNEARIRFEFRAGQIGEAIQGRMVDYEQVLRGGLGLYGASTSVERHEWRTYVEHLRIEAVYPGIQAIGFAPEVSAARRSQHEVAVRAEGFPKYEIHPADQRAAYVPILYIEPFTGRNQGALGFDMLSEPARRAAIEGARDSGEPTISGKVTLVQDTGGENPQSGILMYVPVYRNGTDSITAAQRRVAIVGYVYGAFRMSDLMRGILGKLVDVRLQVVDGGPGNGDTTLYDSSPDSASRVPEHEVTANLPLHGRTWMLRVASLPAFEESVDRRTPRLVATASGALGVLLLAIIWLLATQRARAAQLARTMTRDLRESRERLALAVEGSNLALLDWNVATGKVTLSEQWSRILGGGLERTETSIKELQALVHPDDLPTVLKMTADLVRGRILHYRVEHRVKAVDGDWRWISSRAKVVERNADGRALRVAGTNVDISERKAIERLKNEFIATVSHELRTPLTAIIGALGLLKQQAAGTLPADAALFLDMAQKNSERLAALINDILNIEKLESGQAELRSDPVAVATLLKRAVELNAPYAEKFGVRFELRRPLPDATVCADEDRLLQIITNLMSNAAKFSPHGQIITVGAELRGEKVRVTVFDHGAGIPREFRSRIFGKFSQADSSDSRGKGGSGLGLSICKTLIERMSGTIDFESEPGKGTTFYFELPLAAGSAPAPQG